MNEGRPGGRSASITVTSLQSPLWVTGVRPAWIFSIWVLRTQSIAMILASLAAIRFSASLFIARDYPRRGDVATGFPLCCRRFRFIALSNGGLVTDSALVDVWPGFHLHVRA